MTADGKSAEPVRSAPGENSGQMAFDVGDAAERQSGYRGPTVCKIVGITYRQLDYWARTELVLPSVRAAQGSGSQRLYSFDDVVQLRVVKRLLDTGVSLQRVRMAIDELRSRGQSLADCTLMSDGTSVYAVDDNAQVIDLLQRGQGVFAIALGPVVEELKGEVTAFPSERLETDADEEPGTPDDGGDAGVTRLAR